ncbi:MAG: VOC family protein [Dokdonella sp.]|uniref:VOC family protein n=1 Tax=Dokdonella sp. TaxID=2291710 RepID=UPI003F7F4CA5
MRPDHLTLLVSSLERSMPYYGTLLPALGFAKTKPHVWSSADGFHLQFLEARAETRPYERYGAGMNHVGFSATTPEQVHALRATLSVAGFAVGDVQDIDGATAFFAKDPDGIRFELTYYPPGASVVD